ncbi:uncharacterized protein GGS22DRAFT_169203 [Annulohypoxylon maeteangense]|uniref:uncharacterized protein n=1 Tax=Annulohypoxylon maeteangense TaxID=1927788 RepID=UPI002007B5CF|nr:uncharacterized protein GGS22DRAFT_169203 [Annulohypoxylon maeteangense]KAI0882985.1 hypothetical protein GGS22DRAFT_169203 [Annulohypoxylon maeteangense]
MSNLVRPQPLSSQTRVHPFNGIWPMTRVILISLSTAFCAIVLGISIALAADPAVGSYVVVWTAPQAGAALLWSGIEVVTAYTGGKNHRDIHPGAHVAVHLLLWLGFGIGVGLTACILAFAVSFNDFDPYPENYDYYGRDPGHGYYSEYYIHSIEAVIAFLGLHSIVHFSLFAGACVEILGCREAKNTMVVDISSEHSEHRMQQPQLVQLPLKDEKRELRTNAM